MLLVFLTASTATAAAGTSPTTSTTHYSEVAGIPGPHIIKLPMRDGVKLHTVWALPGQEKGHTFTTVIDRSPYGQTATELIADVFLPFGYAAVGQDFRGTELSEGTFQLWKCR
jgi:predicted acyl esterase